MRASFRGEDVKQLRSVALEDLLPSAVVLATEARRSGSSQRQLLELKTKQQHAVTNGGNPISDVGTHTAAAYVPDASVSSAWGADSDAAGSIPDPDPDIDIDSVSNARLAAAATSPPPQDNGGIHSQGQQDNGRPDDVRDPRLDRFAQLDLRENQLVSLRSIDRCGRSCHAGPGAR